MVKSKTHLNVKIIGLKSKTETWMILNSETEGNTYKWHFKTCPKGLQDFLILSKFSETHKAGEKV